MPGDLDLDVNRMVVINRVTSDAHAHAVELVAHTCVLEELRAGQHQYKKMMTAHISRARVRTLDTRCG